MSSKYNRFYYLPSIGTLHIFTNTIKILKGHSRELHLTSKLFINLINIGENGEAVHPTKISLRTVATLSARKTLSSRFLSE